MPVREILQAMIESPLYWTLSVQERLASLKHLFNLYGDGQWGWLKA